MARALLLDLDGTLVDSRADLATAVNLSRRDLGLPGLPEAVVVGNVGDGARLLLERCLPEAPHRLEEGLAAFRAHYLVHLLDRTRPYPGVAEALARLRGAGWRLAVVTNKPGDATRALLAGLGPAFAFDAVVAGGDAPALKPDPGPLRQALEACGAGVAGSWMAGDHVTDLEAARRAGLRRCLCRYGFGRPGPEGWDLAVDAPGELADHLVRIPPEVP